MPAALGGFGPFLHCKVRSPFLDILLWTRYTRAGLTTVAICVSRMEVAGYVCTSPIEENRRRRK